MLIEIVSEREHEFVCSWCGYGVVVARPPLACPVCHSLSPDFAAWQAFRELGESLPDLSDDTPRAA